MGTPECRQGFTLTQNVSSGFLFCSTPPTQGSVNQLHFLEMSCQGVISSNEAGNNPGLFRAKGQ